MDMGGFRNVGLNRDAATAQFANVRGDGFRGRRLFAIIYGDVSAGFGKSQSDGLANAPAGASDESDAIG
jgi:hypothetical protein